MAASCERSASRRARSPSMSERRLATKSVLSERSGDTPAVQGPEPSKRKRRNCNVPSSARSSSWRITTGVRTREMSCSRPRIASKKRSRRSCASRLPPFSIPALRWSCWCQKRWHPSEHPRSARSMLGLRPMSARKRIARSTTVAKGPNAAPCSQRPSRTTPPPRRI